MTELRWRRAPKTQIFAENRRFSQIHPFSWKFQHLEGAGNRRFSQKTQGAVKGVYLKGLFAQGRLFYREMDCPVRFHREMGCPVQWSLATPSALESQSRANQGSVVANPICKCRRHKAGHLQVRVALGKRSTCVLKEAPLNKGPLGFPQKTEDFRRNCRKPQIGLRHLRSVAPSSAL